MAITEESIKAPSKDAVRKAAESAARIYLVTGKKKRTLHECIGWAASEEGVPGEVVRNYLLGVAVRAMLCDSDIAFELLEKSQSQLFAFAGGGWDLMSEDAKPVPEVITNGMCLEADQLQMEITEFMEAR